MARKKEISKGKILIDITDEKNRKKERGETVWKLCEQKEWI